MADATIFRPALTDRIILSRNPAIPDSRRDEDEAASGGEPDQKRHRQIKIRAHRARCRKSAAQIRVKRAGPRALQTFLEDQIHGLVSAGEGGGAILGADHARRGGRGDAIRAQGPAAIRADGDGFSLMLGTFHGGCGAKLRHRWLKCKSETSFLPTSWSICEEV